MRIVIIGGTGNIGTALIRVLGAGHELHVVARRSLAHHGSLPESATVHALDISHDDLRPVLAEADAVVHLGWLFQPSHQPEVTWHNNVVGTARVLNSIRPGRASVLVVASSIAAYSPARGSEPVAESYSTHGTSSAAYCREKAYVERLLDVFEADHPDVRVVRLRPAFVFQRTSAAQQRRLFGGPLVPGHLLRPRLLPALPVPRGLSLQAVHSDDVGAAAEAALMSDARGAFNLAADDVLERDQLAALFEARGITVPPRLVRGALAAGWHLRLAPAPPSLFDALLLLPRLSTERARTQLGWDPQHSAADALGTMLAGLRTGTGGTTPPLDPHAGGTARWRELATGSGQRSSDGTRADR